MKDKTTYEQFEGTFWRTENPAQKLKGVLSLTNTDSEKFAELFIQGTFEHQNGVLIDLNKSGSCIFPKVRGELRRNKKNISVVLEKCVVKEYNDQGKRNGNILMTVSISSI